MPARNSDAKVHAAEAENSQMHAPLLQPKSSSAAARRAIARMRRAVSELEVPFDPALIEWRIIKFDRKGEHRGLLMPYADQRAYTDRLNALFTPAGWTRGYTVHTSPNFERRRDRKMVAKVFVTCELKVLGLGAHVATGEEWTDDENAGTSAEAQAFKRACSCFGLGRYLYSFDGVWVGLDERKRARQSPSLCGWATPEGWRHGLRPETSGSGVELQPQAEPRSSEAPALPAREADQEPRRELVRQIRAMAEPLGRRLYRGLLKNVAMAWKPEDVSDISLLEKLLRDMQGAARELDRLRALAQEGEAECLRKLRCSFALRSLDEVTTLERLQALVAATEAEEETRQS